MRERIRLLVSVLIASGVVAGACYLVVLSDKQTKPVQIQESGRIAYSVTRQPDEIKRLATPSPKERTPDKNLIKCISKDRITYTNEGCPHGSRAEPVKIYDSNGFEGQFNAVLHKTRIQTHKDLEKEDFERSKVSMIAIQKNTECKWIQNRNDQIDKESRRALPSESQERLRIEKYENNRKMFSLNC